MSQSSYCLDGHVLPPSGQPQTCFYNNIKDWFGILPSDPNSMKDVQIIPLENKTYEYDSHGIVLTDGPSADLSIMSVAVPPNMMVSLYTDPSCSTLPLATIGGTFAKVLGIPADGYGNVTVDLPDGSSSVQCVKVEKIAPWESFTAACKKGNILQAPCQHYANTTDMFNESGVDSATDPPQPDPNQWIVYVLLFAFIFILVLIVIIAAVHSPKKIKNAPPAPPRASQRPPPPQVSQEQSVPQGPLAPQGSSASMGSQGSQIPPAYTYQPPISSNPSGPPTPQAYPYTEPKAPLTYQSSSPNSGRIPSASFSPRGDARPYGYAPMTKPIIPSGVSSSVPSGPSGPLPGAGIESIESHQANFITTF